VAACAARAGSSVSGVSGSSSASPKACTRPLKVELEEGDDGRWLAEVIDLPGVLADGADREEAPAKVEAVALRVIADRLEQANARRR
jgi:predicted RNase H-like HicB family nuclease